MTAARSGASKTTRFAARGTTQEIEEGLAFAPKFDQDGLISCVVTEAVTGEVLMFAHMNEEALARTIETGEAWFYSRSRGTLWRKGESSGHTLRVQELRVRLRPGRLVDQSATGRAGCLSHRAPELLLSRRSPEEPGRINDGARISRRRTRLRSG